MSRKIAWISLLVWVPVAFSADLVDPTRPSTFTSAVNQSTIVDTEEGLRLQAIFYHPEKPSALINGHRVGVGDQLAEVRVKAIFSDHLVIEDDSGESELRLPVPSVKSRSRSGGGKQ